MKKESKFVMIGVTYKMREEIRKNAKEDGRTLTEYIRRLLQTDTILRAKPESKEEINQAKMKEK